MPAPGPVHTVASHSRSSHGIAQPIREASYLSVEFRAVLLGIHQGANPPSLRPPSPPRAKTPDAAVALASTPRSPDVWHVGCKGPRATTVSHITGENHANHTVSDNDGTARDRSLRSGDQRAHRTQSRREPHGAEHVPCLTYPPTQDRGRGLIDQRPDARELDLEPGAPERSGPGVRRPGLRRAR